MCRNHVGDFNIINLEISYSYVVRSEEKYTNASKLAIMHY